MSTERAFQLDALCETLVLATSTSNASVLQQANQQLEAWETQEQYWEALAHISFETQAPVSLDNETWINVRRLAVIRFKNDALKYWRPRILRTGTVKISDSVKDRIRTRLMQVLHETDRTVGVQAAVAIARIARLDYPSEWPNLVPMLREAIQTASTSIHQTIAASKPLESTASDTLLLLRACDVLRQCLKEFGTVRVLGGKMRMTELARSLIPDLQIGFLQLFADTFDTCGAPVTDWILLPGIQERIRACHLLFKVLIRLVLADTGLISVQVHHSHGKGDNLAYQFFTCTPRHLEKIISVRAEVLDLAKQASQASSLILPLTKFMVGHAKFHRSLIDKMHNKVALWPGWPEVVWWYWTVLRHAAQSGTTSALRKPEAGSDDTYASPSPYRWLVLSLSIVRMTLMAWRRDRPHNSPFTGLQGAQFELDAVDILLSTYLRLTNDDLNRWQANPEEFAMEETQADADLDIRPAAESLLMSLSQWCVRSVRAGVTPEMIPNVAETIFQRFEASNTLDRMKLDDILARDAIYTALGLCRDQLDPNLTEDDDQVGGIELGPHNIHRMGEAIGQRLVPEAVLGAPDVDASWVVIRRRIAWLLWEWSEHVQEATRPQVYGALVQLLVYEPGRTDAAVQLAAARSLTALADTLEFDAEAFSPYLGDALAGLVCLIADGELMEIGSIRTVATALAVLIDRMGPRSVPFASRLIQLVPTLWSHEDPEARAKPSILEFLGKLVMATGPSLRNADDPQLEQLQSTVAHIVSESLSPSMAPLLGYDALLLYVHTLQSAHHISPKLFSLAHQVIPLVSQPDYSPLICRLWEELCLFHPIETLKQLASNMYGALAGLLADRECPVVVSPLKAIECHLQALASQNNPDGLQYFVEVLHSTSLFARLTIVLLRDEESTVIITRFVSVLSRMACTLPAPYFHQLVRASAPIVSQALRSQTQVQAALQNGEAGGLWTMLLPAMLRRVDNMASMRKVKIAALGMAAILRGAQSEQDIEVFRALPQMIGMWTDALGQLVEDADGHSPLYERELSPDQGFEFGPTDEEIDVGLLSTFGELEDTNPSADRWRRLSQSDPAMNQPLRPFILASLNEVLAVHPSNTQCGAVLHEALASIDPLVLDVFKKDLEQPPAS
ncbi:hypothetical protein MPSI1_000375 [Malassezia psittaci]|uniref:Importin N-terminal domain-containing protein n=1 Tax=Malassezia psittaci TaxID=1821823 RepID=A0AAF0F7B6_9BASI|nr:hypothetical protein MPSI1_000375 [Malassezia psittaci]